MPSGSIRGRLLVRLLTAVLLMTIGTAWLVYQSTRTEVNLLFDSSLAKDAVVLGLLLDHEAREEQQRTGEIRRLLAELGPDALQRSPFLAELAARARHASDQRDYLPLLRSEYRRHSPFSPNISFLVRYPTGQIMVRSPQARLFGRAHSGFQTLQRNGVDWRVYSMTMPDTGLLVQVSEKTLLREGTVTELLNKALWPLSLMIPLLAVIIWLAVSDGLVHLRRVAGLLQQRDPDSLELVSVRHVPAEVVPLIVALNQLFQRVEAAIENERQFTANAAHELRNPLAAVKTQVQAFALTLRGEREKALLGRVLESVDRISHLLDQLLVLARADARQRDASFTETNLFLLAQSVLAERGHAAVAKGIDLALEGEEASVCGDPAALGILLGNLVDNAIRYTPGGGRVRVGVHRRLEKVELQVRDNGPGIPAEQREALFERFRRGDRQVAGGSGLGLSIVRRIAELHAASVVLDAPAAGSGLLVRVVFPPRPCRAPSRP